MHKNFLFCRAYKVSLVVLLNILLFNSVTKASEEIDRNWVNSLDVYYENKKILENDKWFQTIIKSMINDNNIRAIVPTLKTKKRKKTSKKGTAGNIAYVNHLIVYQGNNSEIKTKRLDPNIIFMSGGTTFKTKEDYEEKKNLLEMKINGALEKKNVYEKRIDEREKEGKKSFKQQKVSNETLVQKAREKSERYSKSIEGYLKNTEKYKKSVYLASSFYDEATLLKDFSDPNQKRKHIEDTNRKALETLLNYLLNDPTHAEASAILYLFGGFSERDKLRNDKNFVSGEVIKSLEEINVEANNSPVKIIGSIFLVATLKDPCPKFCMPMFETFQKKLLNILKNKVKNYKNITVKDDLENLVLIGGVQPYQESPIKTTRSRMNVKNIQIDLNFTKPSNRLYSSDFGAWYKSSREKGQEKK